MGRVLEALVQDRSGRFTAERKETGGAILLVIVSLVKNAMAKA